MGITETRDALEAATTLEEVCEIFNTHDMKDVDISDLPTFGGDCPAIGEESIWSWDEERLLVGSCGEDMRIISRTEWMESMRSLRKQGLV